MLLSGISWNIPRVTCIFSSLLACVYQENTSDKWDIPLYTTRKHCRTIFLAIENTAPDVKVGCNAIKYTMAFLCSLNGINKNKK